MLIKSVLALSFCALTFSGAALANDHPVNQQWQDQETWCQFTDKETGGGFKMSKPRPASHLIKPESVLAPHYRASDSEQTNTASIAMPVVIDPGSPVEAPSMTHIETTMVPMGQPGSFARPYFGASGWGQGGNYWGGGAFGLPYAAPRYGSWRSSTRIFGGSPAVGFRPSTRLVQTGPSKASGNYFHPSTADSSASGSYFAPAGNAPRVMPVYVPEHTPKDFWGKQGSPLPGEMQPD